VDGLSEICLIKGRERAFYGLKTAQPKRKWHSRSLCLTREAAECRNGMKRLHRSYTSVLWIIKKATPKMDGLKKTNGL
jgi:transposase-like protein